VCLGKGSKPHLGKYDFSNLSKHPGYRNMGKEVGGFSNYRMGNSKVRSQLQPLSYKNLVTSK
jgi:hypothetical protein